MKYKFLPIMIIAGLLLASSPALAAAQASKQDKLLKVKLLQLKQKQQVSGVRIKRNLAQVKTKIVRTKKLRTVEKQRRAVVKQRASSARTTAGSPVK